jgi:hypothetical protein
MPRLFSLGLVAGLSIFYFSGVQITRAASPDSPKPVPPLPSFGLSPLAKQIVGSWETRFGLQHVRTYLSDGRFGLDTRDPKECSGQWRLEGNRLYTYWGSPMDEIVLEVTRKRMTTEFRGKKFIADRVP